ncbi:putative Acyl-CoA N-acyltransferase (Nat) [Herminiimonas arsenicoxydans]|uniref:Acyl-CoA N-acyltransferase (Nat) n=1 Tax=Herminiimonas arsenicoxydans TaxID=204773 RepID=A4G3F0_HERAR|nr:putative Acyl-CoA N-acyltransferase (Nat) [Herminiimonas arsenicoxydans]
MTEITFRPATADDAAAIAALRVDSWRATYRGVMPDAYLDGMRAEESATMWSQVLLANVPTISIFVAVAGDEIVGFAAGMLLMPAKFELNAELTAIYLKPIAQRGGVGRRLLALVAGALQQQGASGLLVWVIADNQAARQFYEQLGAELLIEQPFTWDGLNLMEAGYGWRDMAALQQACTE